MPHHPKARGETAAATVTAIIIIGAIVVPLVLGVDISEGAPSYKMCTSLHPPFTWDYLNVYIYLNPASGKTASKPPPL